MAGWLSIPVARDRNTMRTITYLGLGLIVCGALVVVASSGAFDATVADRGVGVETADDDDALVGIDRPPSSLSVDDGEFVCTDGDLFCYDGYFEYTDVFVTITDQTPSTEFEEATVDELSTPNDNPTIGSVEVLSDNGVYTIEGIAQCDVDCTGGWSGDACRGFLGSGEAEQVPASQTATADLEVSGETISVDLSRTVDIECESGSVTEP